MNNPPFFSIVTVVLNDSGALQNTAESINSQVEKDFQWIVVDGGSEDGTCAVARQSMNSERDTLISEPDDGVYFAMNKGLQIAQGHLVVFMNAGDRFATSETLASVRGAYKADLDVVHGDVKFDTPRAGVVLRRSKDSSRGVSRRVFASHQAVYIRRTTHLCHQFDTSYKFAADYAVFAKLHTMGYSFCYLPMPLSITIVDASSLSVKNRPAMAWEDFQINLKIIKWNWFAALSAYILSITKIVIVKMLLAFPNAAMRLLPKKFGNRLY